MKVIRNRKTLVDYIERQREMGKKIGFAPTMGALHLGHLSLYESAKKENDEVISSIFINPTQFNNLQDFTSYPQSLDHDLQLLETAGVDAVYVPNIEDIYPEELKSTKYDFDGLEKEMEGKHRPGHFDGVGTVVEILFRQVQPHHAYFGEKDFQQLAIIKKMVQKLNLPIKIHAVPTLREEGGLAMSSRNLRLTPSQREAAPLIYNTLLQVQKWFGEITIEEIQKKVKAIFKNSDLNLEYFTIANEETLKEVNFTTENNKYRAFIAVFAGEVRLIDNIALV